MMYYPARQRRRSSGRKGAALAELAILLPFLVFVFVIAIDWARIFYYTVTIDNCARNGAIYASQVFNSQEWQGTSAQIQDVQNAAVADAGSLNPALKTSDVNIATIKDSDGNSAVVVTVNYTFKTIINYPGIPSQVSLVRTAQMRLAPQVPT